MIKKIPSIVVPIIQKGDTSSISLSDELRGKKIIMFGVPGAFTPTCSEKHMPSYIKLYEQFINKGIDDIYCLSVNDSFVMNAWAKEHEIENVKMIPDGSGEFTRDMDMIVFKPAQNFGLRSWRYAMIVNDMEIEQMIVEPGKNQQGLDDDPYEETKPENILSKL